MRHTTIILLTILLCFLPASLVAQGLPLLTNYSAKDYGAHNNNFDILTDDDGVVYVANFEGLLYFDKSRWQIIHTPGINRITSLFRDHNKRIWTCGYNFLGYLDTDTYGRLQLKAIDLGTLHGEVGQLREENEQLCFSMTNGISYRLEEMSIVKLEGQAQSTGENETQILNLDDGLTVIVEPGNGLVLKSKNGQTICHLTEENGLCSNSISRVTYDGHGTLWGATSKGIFAVAIPSKYAIYNAYQGLKGELTDIEELDSVLFVSTSHGVFRKEGAHFLPIENISHMCWQLYQKGHTLLAATSTGIFSIDAKGNARQLSNENATAVMGTPDLFYSGEMNGVVLNNQGQRTTVADIEKATKIYIDSDQCLWIEDIYGQVWQKPLSAATFRLASEKGDIATMVVNNKKVNIISVTDTIDFPQFTIADKFGYTWMTNYEGKKLHAMKGETPAESLAEEIAPFSDNVIKALYHEKDFLWIGGEFGLINIANNYSDASLSTTPRLRIRNVILHNDSVVWGGFGDYPQSLPQFDSNDHNVTITYALDFPSYAGITHYRYRMNGGFWSAWSPLTQVTFSTLATGDYTFEVQAIDPFGRTSETVSMNFSIEAPIYMKWYMQIIYLLLFGLLVYAILQWRMRRLEKEKIRLEDIVRQRTAEVTKQKNEIEEKSDRLQLALDELAMAQHKLIRQEKMATAGKLTQGLIDRILNPMNYINNFSKLSCGLLKDLKANIEDEEEHIDKDNFEDTMDVIDMLDQNLQKVEQHGLSTTRTLKAMEEILKDRSGGLAPMNLVHLLKQNEEMVRNYYKQQIDTHDIRVIFSIPDDEVPINGNAEQLSKTFMSILGNAVYAVTKKSARQQYQPEVKVTLLSTPSMATLTIEDNGIGIEQGIIHKIFDPFFTTKTTGEASGVGLYLSHEILQNHGGDISVQSEKDRFTIFTITLPILHN